MQQALTLNEKSSPLADPPRILAFEIEHEGHYAGYILNLARYWRESSLPGSLDFVVTKTFCEWHTDVVEEIESFGASSNVRLVSMTKQETTRFGPALGLAIHKAGKPIASMLGGSRPIKVC